MKKAFKKHYCLSLLIGGIMTIDGKSEPPTSEPEQTPRHVGNWHTNQVATKQATHIVVAVFRKIKMDSLASTGALLYRSEIEITSIIKGTITGKRIGYFVYQVVPPEAKQIMPEVDIKYIMFLTELGAGECQINKILPATDGNSNVIRAVIDSQSQGKK